MKFSSPLIEATLIKRYKRFLADVKLPDGSVVVAHVPNSGSMLGVSDPGSRCRISKAANPERKLGYTLEMVQTSSGYWAGVNTSLTNALVQEAFENKLVPGWKSFSEFKREVKISPESRLDFLLSKTPKSGERLRYVEVKNVSMARPPCAVFPDAITVRGQKHLMDLSSLAKSGNEAELFFVVQREDCESFKPCDDIDPVYGEILRKVAKQNVLISCWVCKLTPNSITLSHPIPVVL